MPVPGSVISISSIPFSRTVTQAEFNGGTFGNAPNEVWFEYIALVPIVLGVQTDFGGSFIPRRWVYESDGSTLVVGAQPSDSIGGKWSPLLSAGTYYVKIENSLGGSSDFDFTSNFDTAPLDGAIFEEGDILINDDAEGMPATLWTAEGTLKSFISTVPSGEMAALLPNGTSIWYDAFGLHSADPLAIVDSDLQYVTSVAAGVTAPGGPNPDEPAITADDTQFYVFNQSGELWTVSAAGVAVDTGYVAPSVPFTMGIDAAGTTIYWGERTSGDIHTLDVGSLTAGSDLYSIPGFGAGDELAATVNDNPGEIHVLEDGTVVTFWYDSSENENHILHLAADGSVLHDITFDGSVERIDHIRPFVGSIDAILIWLYTDVVTFSTGRFGTLTLSTGLITEDFAKPLFGNGANQSDEEMFGPSSSCVMLNFGGGGSGGSGGGSPEELPEGKIGPIAWVEEWEDAA